MLTFDIEPALVRPLVFSITACELFVDKLILDKTKSSNTQSSVVLSLFSLKELGRK